LSQCLRKDVLVGRGLRLPTLTLLPFTIPSLRDLIGPATEGKQTTFKRLTNPTGLRKMLDTVEGNSLNTTLNDKDT